MRRDVADRIRNNWDWFDRYFKGLASLMTRIRSQVEEALQTGEQTTSGYYYSPVPTLAGYYALPNPIVYACKPKENQVASVVAILSDKKMPTRKLVPVGYAVGISAALDLAGKFGDKWEPIIAVMVDNRCTNERRLRGNVSVRYGCVDKLDTESGLFQGKLEWPLTGEVRFAGRYVPLDKFSAARVKNDDDLGTAINDELVKHLKDVKLQ